MAKLLFGDKIGKNGKIRIGCSAVIFDGETILLTRRVDNGQWCLPSGGVEPGESVKETCIREVKEETGLIIDPFRLIGIYSNPNVLIQYPDGNQVQLIAICFEAKINDGVLEISDETTGFGFFSREQIQSMDVLQNHLERIEDAFKKNIVPEIK
ncbi:MAG: NUDIX domain-containing protein [Candidatus Promineifilaceae bacterium]